MTLTKYSKTLFAIILSVFTIMSYKANAINLEDFIKALNTKNIPLASKLIQEASGIKETTKNGHTILHIAAFYGFTDIVNEIIKKDQTLIYTPDKLGRTPLHWATRFNRITTVKILINKCPEAACVIDINGNTSLDLAQLLKYTEIEAIIKSTYKHL